MTQSATGDHEFDPSVANRRERDRSPLIFRVTCVTYCDPAPDVWLTDVSLSGCRLFAREGMFRDGESIVIVRPDGERHRGEVAWVSKEKAGVRFDVVLPQAALNELVASAQMLARATNDSEPLVDNFGRKLAPLIPLSRFRP